MYLRPLRGCCQYCDITFTIPLKYCNHWQIVQKGKRATFGSLHTHLALFQSNAMACNRNIDLRLTWALRRQLIRVSQFESVNSFFSLDSLKKHSFYCRVQCAHGLVFTLKSRWDDDCYWQCMLVLVSFAVLLAVICRDHHYFVAAA